MRQLPNEKKAVPIPLKENSVFNFVFMYQNIDQTKKFLMNITILMDQPILPVKNKRSQRHLFRKRNMHSAVQISNQSHIHDILYTYSILTRAKTKRAQIFRNKAEVWKVENGFEGVKTMIFILFLSEQKIQKRLFCFFVSWLTQRLERCNNIMFGWRQPANNYNMKGQQISPWSIYNQKLLADSEQPYTKEVKVKPNLYLPPISLTAAPNLKQQFMPLSKRLKANSELRNNSYSLTTVQTSQLFDPFSSEYVNEDSTIDIPHRIVGHELDKQRLNLSRLLDKRVLIKFIREQIKEEYQEAMVRSPISSDEEQVPPKADFSFPRLNFDRNLAIFNVKHALSGKPHREKEFEDGEMSKQTIRLLLKKSIKSMISNRMRIMGKSKELSIKK